MNEMKHNQNTHQASGEQVHWEKNIMWVLMEEKKNGCTREQNKNKTMYKEEKIKVNR